MPYTDYDLVSVLSTEYSERYHEDLSLDELEAYDAELANMTTSELEEEFMRLFNLDSEDEIESVLDGSYYDS